MTKELMYLSDDEFMDQLSRSTDPVLLRASSLYGKDRERLHYLLLAVRDELGFEGNVEELDPDELISAIRTMGMDLRELSEAYDETLERCRRLETRTVVQILQDAQARADQAEADATYAKHAQGIAERECENMRTMLNTWQVALS